jgi:hypothetical protein
MAHYDDSLTMREARRIYFDANQFGADGGYGDPFGEVQVRPLPDGLNTASRVRAVRFHDLHQVMTGYETSNQGEGEIGAWELGSGCADHHAAWVLNLTALGAGLLVAPRATYRAFGACVVGSVLTGLPLGGAMPVLGLGSLLLRRLAN